MSNTEPEEKLPEGLANVGEFEPTRDVTPPETENDLELSDSQLESVAGGCVTIPP